MFAALTQLFLIGFGLDAVLSFWCEFYAIESGEIAEIRLLIAASVVFQGTILYLGSGFSNRISTRLVVWPVLFLFWAKLTGCFPLPFFYLPSAGTWIAGIQLLYAFILVGAFWRRPSESSRGGFIDPEAGQGGFEGRRFLLFLAANVVLLPLLGVGALLDKAIVGIEQATQGYVRIRPSGLYITQTSFKKNDRVVALDGMIHLADAGFYRKMNWSVEGMKTLVLMEGVSDRNGLLAGGLGMERLSKLFGLTSQMNEGEYRKTMDALRSGTGPVSADPTVQIEPAVDVKRADVDVNTFHPATIDYLKAVGTLFQSKTWEDAAKIVQNKQSPLQNEKMAQGAMEDILILRNKHLFAEIEKGLQTHDRVVVPWGAMHLAGIERDLRASGFVEETRVEKPAILFWK